MSGRVISGDAWPPSATATAAVDDMARLPWRGLGEGFTLSLLLGLALGLSGVGLGLGLIAAAVTAHWPERLGGTR